MSSADQVRAYLAVRHADCPGCGYDLHGVGRPRCPECGRELDVLMLAGGRRAWQWGTVSAGPALIAANLVLALVILGSAMSRQGTMPVLAWLAPAVIGAFVCSVAYWPVFLRYQARTIEDPHEALSAAWVVALMQVGGLVLLWV